MYFLIFKQNIPRIFWGYFWISSHLSRQPWLLLSCLDPLKTWSHDRFKSDLSIILGYSNLKDVKENFYFHLSVLKSSTFCAFCEAQVYLGNMFMPCSQSNTFDFQSSFFNMNMVHNFRGNFVWREWTQFFYKALLQSFFIYHLQP